MVRKHLTDQQRAFQSKEASGHEKRLRKKKEKEKDAELARAASKFFKPKQNSASTSKSSNTEHLEAG